MIAADTNLIVRHLTHDDPTQTAVVGRMFGEAEARGEPIFLGQLVLCELTWTLAAVYDLGRTEIASALRALLDDDVFVVQDRASVEEALALYKRGPGGFADHLIGLRAKREGASTTYTFDKRLARAAGFTLAK